MNRRRVFSSYRLFSTFHCTQHENPLGLPRKGDPQLFRKGPIPKRRIPHVKHVFVVASGKGGVGKSTIAVNLAFSLARLPNRLRVGVLDLDIFGPSVPTLMGLRNNPEPELTSRGAIRPLVNHGLPSMSMGYLLPRPDDADDNSDSPVVWRGLMVQKAVQQLLFDVDWSANSVSTLDALVIDMPPGTGDVPLSLGQLVQVDGAVIVSTPQDLAISDVRKGIAMFRKISVPIMGVVLNESHFVCPNCSESHLLFGSPDRFRNTAKRLGIDILAELPLVPGVSSSADIGVPYGLLAEEQRKTDGAGGLQWNEKMSQVAARLWEMTTSDSK